MFISHLKENVEAFIEAYFDKDKSFKLSNVQKDLIERYEKHPNSRLVIKTRRLG